MQPYLSDISSELADLFQYMLDNRLMDIVSDPDAPPTQNYTAPLDAYGSAFLLLPYRAMDAFNMVQSFGLFADYCLGRDSVPCTDISYIHIWGLEVLYVSLAERLVGEDKAPSLRSWWIKVMLTNDVLPIGEVFQDVQRQTEKGIEMSCYPYVNLHSEVGRSETAFFLYQVYLGVDESLDSLEMESVELRHNAAAAQSVLDMEISNSEESGALVLRLDYSASRYEKESMERFGRLFKDAVSSLLARLGEKGVTCGELKPVL